MTYREHTLIGIKDILEQLSGIRRQLEWTENAQAFQLIREKMVRDLDRCKRLCESLRAPAGGRLPEAA